LKGKEEREADLVASLESARYSAELSLSKASELAGRVETIEQQYKRQQKNIEDDYVSRDQVESMDQMFRETVDRLSARLEKLAEQNEILAGTGAGGGRNINLDANSRAILGDMEKRHNPFKGPNQVNNSDGGGGGGRRSSSRSRGEAENILHGGVSLGYESTQGRGVRIEPGKLRPNQGKSGVGRGRF
jgi:hypothetical protein